MKRKWTLLLNAKKLMKLEQEKAQFHIVDEEYKLDDEPFATHEKGWVYKGINRKSKAVRAIKIMKKGKKWTDIDRKR